MKVLQLQRPSIAAQLESAYGTAPVNLEEDQKRRIREFAQAYLGAAAALTALIGALQLLCVLNRREFDSHKCLTMHWAAGARRRSTPPRAPGVRLAGASARLDR